MKHGNHTACYLLLLDDAELEHLKKVLRYLRESELTHYEESERDETHIFRSVLEVERALVDSDLGDL